jgi:hypothetical protein
MQRRLTDDEESILDDYVDAAQRLELRGIAVPHELAQQMLEHGTTDGLPYVEPPLTDEDARQRPWVMVRDDFSTTWNGPKILVCVTKEKFSFNAMSPSLNELNGWQYARRATAEEIAAAGLEVAE